MDPQELVDWCDFCEGKRLFPCEHFSSMFMEMFCRPLSAKDKDDLRKVFSYFPNSALTLENLFRIGGEGCRVRDKEVASLVVQEMKAIRPLITNTAVLAVIDTRKCELIADESRFDEARASALSEVFFNGIGDYVIKNMLRRPYDDFRLTNDMCESIYEAFYKISNNLQLQTSLMADLIGTEVRLHNYFELYLIGVDYALESSGAVAYSSRWLCNGRPV